MPSGRIQRRKQFSSCDACRRSRVACDAMHRHSPREAEFATCSRCKTRNRRCTFEWMKRTTPSSNRTAVSLHRWNEALSPSPTYIASSSLDLNTLQASELQIQGSPATRICERPLTDLNDETTSPSSQYQPITSETSVWLRDMYENVFEAVFGSWLGNYSCPFAFGERGHLDNDTNMQPGLSLSVSISSICRQFDQLMKNLESQSKPGSINHPPSQRELQKEFEIEATLNKAIQTFSARWLPLSCTSPAQRTRQAPLIQTLWREFRKDLSRSINRPCYRSMLSLYLFAMVPVPVGIDEEEEEDGLPAQMCVQAALQQVQFLRARQRSLEFNGSKVSLPADQATPISTPDQIRTEFMDIESMIYWAALTFDTSSSLTFNTKSILSSGLLGWESETSWRMVKACTNIFHEQSEDWRTHGLSVTEETANQIIAAAQAWKLYVWKMGTILKEALREGHGENSVQRAFSCAEDAIQQFNTTYRPLLEACERRLQFLSQYTKLRWYELMVHHHLCILIMIDAVEIASRQDILDKMTTTRSEAEGSLLNCLQFGLNNCFKIPRRRDTENNAQSFPLVAVDPYPHHVVAGVQLLWKSIERDYSAGKLDQVPYDDLQSILLRTLELLPQASKSVREATDQARRASMDNDRFLQTSTAQEAPFIEFP